jgi:hypothetical protein
MKKLTFLIALAGLAGSLCVTAEEGEQPTKWQPIPKPMSALLDEGWTIQQFSARDTDWQVSTTLVRSGGVSAGSPEATAVWPRSFEAAFILTKGGKYVVCFVTDPTAGDAKSKCRALN